MSAECDSKEIEQGKSEFYKRWKAIRNDPVKKMIRELRERLDDLLDDDEDYQKERHLILKEADRKLNELRRKYYNKYTTGI